jgi:heat shock protein HslJ
VILILTLLLAACSGGAATPAAAPTAAPTEVLPTEVVKAEAPAEPASIEAGELTGTTWAWIGFTDPAQEVAIEAPLSYTLTFQGEGSVAVKADCNNAMGSYTVENTSLKIEIGPMTKAACPPGSRSNDFVKYLGAAAIYFFEDGNLLIDLMADGGTMAFAPAEAMMADDGEGAIAGSLSANPWQWVSFTNPVDQYQIDNPENYTLTFNDDGTVTIKADCNNAAGSYTSDDSNVTIEVGPSTMALCPPESRSEDFIKYLGFSAGYFFDGGHLFIDLMADGGTLEFAQAAMGMMDEGGVIEVSLTSHAWELGSYVYEGEAKDIDTPENYTLTFNDDGTVNIKADCNNAIGSYTDDGSNLSVEVGPTTLAACPPESRSEDFIKLVGLSGTYEIAQGYLFVATNDGNGILNFHLQNVTTAEFSPDAEPIYGTLSMGSENYLHIDPLMVSVSSGLVEGYGVDAKTLGPGCTGMIPSRPDVVFNWEGYEGINQLRVFFLSQGDPTMVLVTPSGEALCNDDLNPLMLDPFIEIKDPQPGRYAAFIGSFEPDMVHPGFLVVTTQEYDPVTLDISQLFPREVDPRTAASETISLDELDLESGSAVQPINGGLDVTGLPYQQKLTAGGELGIFNLDQSNELCTGFINAAPTFRFDWSGDLEQLVFYYESNADTTINILAPDGNFYCDDDYQGADNLNPLVSLAPTAGTYYVWVGSFAPDVMVDGTLSITSDANASPAVLTSKDLK